MEVMKKLAYSNDETGLAAIVAAVPKHKIEEILGPMTDEEYENHVISRSIPQGKKFKKIDDAEIPAEREFRDAWIFDENAEKIAIEGGRAKDLALKKLRAKRNKALDESDKLLARAQEIGTPAEVQELKAKRQKLRDITNTLKGFEAEGKMDDEALLAQIKSEMNQDVELSKLKVAKAKA